MADAWASFPGSGTDDQSQPQQPQPPVQAQQPSQGGDPWGSFPGAGAPSNAAPPRPPGGPPIGGSDDEGITAGGIEAGARSIARGALPSVGAAIGGGLGFAAGAGLGLPA